MHAWQCGVHLLSSLVGDPKDSQMDLRKGDGWSFNECIIQGKCEEIWKWPREGKIMSNQFAFCKLPPAHFDTADHILCLTFLFCLWLRHKLACVQMGLRHSPYSNLSYGPLCSSDFFLLNCKLLECKCILPFSVSSTIVTSTIIIM